MITSYHNSHKSFPNLVGQAIICLTHIISPLLSIPAKPSWIIIHCLLILNSKASSHGNRSVKIITQRYIINISAYKDKQCDMSSAQILIITPRRLVTEIRPRSNKCSPSTWFVFFFYTMGTSERRTYYYTYRKCFTDIFSLEIRKICLRYVNYSQ